MIAPHERAEHALRVKAAKLAEAAVSEQYRLRPDLHERYGPAGQRYCVRDVARHVLTLAASVGFGDPARFARYAEWAGPVLAAYGIPESDLAGSLRALRWAVGVHLAPDVAAQVYPHLDAGLAAVHP